MIEKLKDLNNKFMEINCENKEALKKYQLIDKILSEDKVFFKIPIEVAYSILRDLGFKEDELNEVYMNLIDSKNFN